MSRWQIDSKWTGACTMTINDEDVITINDSYRIYAPLIVSRKEAMDICEALNKGMTCNIGLEKLLKHPSHIFQRILKDRFKEHKDILFCNHYYNESNGALLLECHFKNGVEDAVKLNIINDILQIGCDDIISCSEDFYFIDTTKFKKVN